MKHLLIVDDDDFIRDALDIFFRGKGFKVTTAPNGLKALDAMKIGKFDLVLMDLMMPDMGGLDLLKKMAELKISAPTIVMTAFATVQTAVQAMKLGAFDYITKPFVMDELMMVVERGIGVSELQNENRMLKRQLRKKYKFEGLIGDSPKMQQVYEMIEKIFDIDSTILITGESGTGKELIAKTIHYNSLRAQQPFIPLNCAAIPKDLLESELFGHEKGAFTGALNTRIGRFELAAGGTLFLDEIGEMDMSLQGKVLRIIQGKEFERVGGSKTIKVDVRIVTATNKDLEKAIEEGKFREDLFYRLNVIPVHLPPLRERVEDIPLLVDFFKKELMKKRKKESVEVSPAAMECLIKYHWPGNVRELENLLERMTILVSKDTIEVSDLPPKFQVAKAETNTRTVPVKSPAADQPGQRSAEKSLGRPDIPDQKDPAQTGVSLSDSGVDLAKAVEQMERDLIMQALGKTGGVKSKAAKLLGLNRTTLVEKMKKMNIEAAIS